MNCIAILLSPPRRTLHVARALVQGVRRSFWMTRSKMTHPSHAVSVWDRKASVLGLIEGVFNLLAAIHGRHQYQQRASGYDETQRARGLVALVIFRHPVSTSSSMPSRPVAHLSAFPAHRPTRDSSTDRILSAFPPLCRTCPVSATRHRRLFPTMIEDGGTNLLDRR